MYKSNLDVIEFGKWNRKILNIYWLVSLLLVLTEVIVFLVRPPLNRQEACKWLMLYVLKPTLMNTILLLVTEGIYRIIENKYKEKVKYLVMISSTFLVFNVIYIHYNVTVAYTVFILPIFLSQFYANKRITWFTAILNFLCYLIIVLLYLPTKEAGSFTFSYTDFYAVLSLMITAVILVLSFNDRAKEIMEYLLLTHHSKNELTIKNFVMEFNSKIETTTGLYNHKTFYEYLEQLICQSENYRFPLSLAVIDIDDFKKVNDSYGHSLGDKVIKSLAETIKINIGSDDYAARYGGEEFAIIFTDKDEDEAFKVAENIRIEFNKIIIDEMKNEKFSISIGISEHSKGMTMQSFFSNADNALYKAKKEGKNRTIISNL